MTAVFRTRHLLLSLIAAGALAAPLLLRAYRRHREHRFDSLIEAAAVRHGVDAKLVSAVIWRESGYRPDRVGRAGEIGLMQVCEPAAREWARAAAARDFQQDHLYDPGTNILAGTWYLGRALRRWGARDEPESFALAEYNAGLTHARRWAALAADGTSSNFQEAVTFPTTRAYIRAILNRYQRTP
ncbi:MAG: lytic transglycosylase domain-containing protein [Kiritimatiellia bacterium]